MLVPDKRDLVYYKDGEDTASLHRLSLFRNKLRELKEKMMDDDNDVVDETKESELRKLTKAIKADNPWAVAWAIVNGKGQNAMKSPPTSKSGRKKAAARIVAGMSDNKFQGN